MRRPAFVARAFELYQRSGDGPEVQAERGHRAVTSAMVCPSSPAKRVRAAIIG